MQPRKIDESVISEKPPHVREIWYYFLRKANHKNDKRKKLKRGQLITSYDKIISDLKWKVGYRLEGYKKHHCETAMKLLTKENMITSTRTTRGMIITICKYDYYQNSKNYETDSETDDETDNETVTSQDTIDKNVKNDKNNISIKTWRNDFETYLTECKLAYKNFVENKEKMEIQKELNPGVNVELSIKKGFTNFWGNQRGWNNKKKKGTKNIDWEATIINSIALNKVYLPKR